MWDPAKYHGGTAAASRAYDRSNPARYKGASEAKRVAAGKGTGDATAASRAAHRESDARYQYQKPVVTKREPTARQ